MFSMQDKKPYNIRIVSTYLPRKCGIATFTKDLTWGLLELTKEIGNVKIAAINNNNGPYNAPVDLIIEQYNSRSWERTIDKIVLKAHENENPTIVLLQHEYGLDPDKEGRNGLGNNYVNMARTFKTKELLTFVYLHTVLRSPNEHQKKILQELADNSDGLIVTTKSAIDILASDIYHIKPAKIKHIDHGIRVQNPLNDRLATKEEFGLEKQLLITTLGLRGPGKGIENSIEAYSKFINTSCTQAQREKLVYLIAGEYHPEFVKFENGKIYQQYEAKIRDTLEKSGLDWCKTEKLSDVDFKKKDVVFLETFLSEELLLKLYTATNMMVLPYLNMDQISSGILADTLGSGRVAIATKFMYACELLNPEYKDKEGIIGIEDPHARGILVDPGEPSIDQIAQGIDYLAFDKDKRIEIEYRARIRGHEMRWDYIAQKLVEHIDFIMGEKYRQTGRGPMFIREKESLYDEKNRQILNNYNS